MGIKKFAAKLAVAALTGVLALGGAATIGGGANNSLLASADAAPVGSGFAFTPTAKGACTSTMVIAIPGGGNTVDGVPDSLPHGFLVGQVANQLSGHGIAQRTVSYRATPFFTLSYDQSMRQGYQKARHLIAQTAAHCPNAKFALVGFSEGSDIASHIIADINAGRGPIPAKRFATAALIANPHNGPESKHKGGTLRDGEGILGAMRGYGKLGDRVLDICNIDDFVCNRYAATPGTREIAKNVLHASAANGFAGLNPMQVAGEAPRIAMGTRQHTKTYQFVSPIPHAVGHVLAHRDLPKAED